MNTPALQAAVGFRPRRDLGLPVHTAHELSWPDGHEEPVHVQRTPPPAKCEASPLELRRCGSIAAGFGQRTRVMAAAGLPAALCVISEDIHHHLPRVAGSVSWPVIAKDVYIQALPAGVVRMNDKSGSAIG